MNQTDGVAKALAETTTNSEPIIKLQTSGIKDNTHATILFYIIIIGSSIVMF